MREVNVMSPCEKAHASFMRDGSPQVVALLLEAFREVFKAGWDAHVLYEAEQERETRKGAA